MRRRPLLKSPWECDLVGCVNQAMPPEEDDPEAWPPVPPDGWVAVEVRRRGWVLPVQHDYCSEAHMQEGMSQMRLRGPDPRPGERA
jgi:hypothetical protein